MSNILTAGGKRFDSLPCPDAYPNAICWLHVIATCPYNNLCSFADRHILKGTLSNTQANKAVAALQAGVTSMVARTGPPSPTGKRKFRVRAGQMRRRPGRWTSFHPTGVTGGLPGHYAWRGRGEMCRARWDIGER